MEWMLMPLKRYAEFSGRSRRMEFWMWQLFKFLVVMAFYLLFFAVAGSALMSGDVNQLVQVGGLAMILVALMGIFGLAVIIPDIAVSIRRLHDTDRTGWWLLAPIIPYLLFWFFAVGAVMSDPKDPAAGLSTVGPMAMILVLVAVAMAIVLLVFYFLEGTHGPNRFGPDPKAAERGGATPATPAPPAPPVT
jgi:uncharacterized membrane protein YhaH (DUF805 family)